MRLSFTRDKRTPLNNRKTTLGHLRALVAAQAGQMATIETQIGILQAKLTTTMHLAEAINARTTTISERMKDLGFYIGTQLDKTLTTEEQP
jgi:hypothetical protein